jgi:glutathione S-transferase
MITLITYPAAFGLPAASPFCLKAMMLLQMSGHPWEPEFSNDPRKMPYAKLPAVRHDGTLIADSDNIRATLETLGIDFDAGLSPKDRAHSRALIRMAEEHIYFHIVLDRWGNDATWPIVRDQYFSAIPALLRKPITNRIRKSVNAGMITQGLGRFSPVDRLARLNPDLAAIATLLDAPFLFGDTPTAADASVAAMLATARATPTNTALAQRIASDPILSPYIDRALAAMLPA